MSINITIPGVYVEEIPPRGAPPKAAAYGAVGFVGKFASGDVNVPTLCSSMSEVYENFGALIRGSSTLENLYWLFKNLPSRVWIVRVQGTAATKTGKDQNASPADRYVFTAKVDGAWANYVAGAGIRVTLAAGTISGTFKATIVFGYTYKGVAQTYTEIYDNLSKTSTDTRYWLTVVNANSKIVTASDLIPAGTYLPALTDLDLAGGADPDYEGTGGTKEGFDLLDTVDEISFYAADSSETSVHTIMIDHAVACGDRQVRLDPPEYSTLAEIKALSEAIDEERASFMGPWQKCFCPIEKVERAFPSSSFYCGVNSRITPPESPSNKIVYGSLGTERDLDKADIYSLEQSRVSPIARWGNRGMRIRNGLTCSSDPNRAMQYRRYMCDWIMETIDENFGWAVSELHTPDFRDALREPIKKWLTDLKTQKWIEDFYVICDETNNPAPIREARKCYCLVAVRLYPAADYVIFQVEVSETAVMVSEAA